MAKRIQRRRVKGWRLPEGAVNCARPGKFGNPFKSPPMSREAAVREHKQYLANNPELVALIKAELRGKDLACFCSLELACHVDNLLETANS